MDKEAVMKTDSQTWRCHFHCWWYRVWKQKNNIKMCLLRKSAKSPSDSVHSESISDYFLHPSIDFLVCINSENNVRESKVTPSQYLSVQPTAKSPTWLQTHSHRLKEKQQICTRLQFVSAAITSDSSIKDKLAGWSARHPHETMFISVVKIHPFMWVQRLQNIRMRENTGADFSQSIKKNKKTFFLLQINKVRIQSGFIMLFRIKDAKIYRQKIISAHLCLDMVTKFWRLTWWTEIWQKHGDTNRMCEESFQH